MTPAAGPTAFVFAGGGSLGSVQAGMLYALVEAGVAPDFLVGSSVGALNAAYFAGAPDLEGAAALIEVWHGLRRSDVFPLALPQILRAFRRSESLVDPGPLRRLIAANLRFPLLEEAQVPLHVMATDQRGASVRLSNGPAIEAVLASAAIPGIFPAVTIAGQQLMDGAIAANTPLSLAARLGARRIIVLPTGYACALEGPPRGAIAQALHAVTLLITWQLMHEIKTTPAEIEVHVAPTLCPLDVSPFDFSASRRLIERATATTREWIADGGLTRPAQARALAAHHHRHRTLPATAPQA